VPARANDIWPSSFRFLQRFYGRHSESGGWLIEFIVASIALASRPLAHLSPSAMHTGANDRVSIFECIPKWFWVMINQANLLSKISMYYRLFCCFNCSFNIKMWNILWLLMVINSCNLQDIVHCMSSLSATLGCILLCSWVGSKVLPPLQDFRKSCRKLYKRRRQSLRVLRRWVACKYAFDYTLQTKAKW